MRTLAAFVLLGIVAIAAEPKPARTQHAVTINGTRIDYEATAATLPLKDEEGKAQANIFYTSYVRAGQTAATRPVTFVFNGGPGSSSVWLHLGAFGPKRVAMTDNGDPLPPPAKLIDNEGSILDLTDLVFIDPVSTGYSRAADEKSPPSASSSAATARRTTAGAARSTSPARATAPPAPRPSPPTCRTASACV
jgi:carboxypeptidase C (cathepsin A)